MSSFEAPPAYPYCPVKSISGMSIAFCVCVCACVKRAVSNKILYAAKRWDETGCVEKYDESMVLKRPDRGIGDISSKSMSSNSLSHGGAGFAAYYAVNLVAFLWRYVARG